MSISAYLQTFMMRIDAFTKQATTVDEKFSNSTGFSCDANLDNVLQISRTRILQVA